MLIDSKKRVIEVYVENTVWGNVSLHSKNKENGFHMVNQEEVQFRDNIQRWCMLRLENPTSEEFEKLTNLLYLQILDYRIVGLMKGRFEDPDSTIQRLTEENTKLAEMVAEQKSELNKLYKESPDQKNIRGIS